MKQLNNQKSEVFLSTYDNSDLLLPVSEEYKNTENICVAVKFGDILIKISSEDTCECTWDEAIEKHRDKLTHPAFWQIVGAVCHEVNQAIEMLGHDPLYWIWADIEENGTQSSVLYAWAYRGSYGYIYANLKNYSSSVRATKVFKIEE